MGRRETFWGRVSIPHPAKSRGNRDFRARAEC
jgi:hypothetical protein